MARAAVRRHTVPCGPTLLPASASALHAQVSAGFPREQKREKKLELAFSGPCLVKKKFAKFFRFSITSNL
jgi:hypothetical protein